VAWINNAESVAIGLRMDRKTYSAEYKTLFYLLFFIYLNEYVIDSCWPFFPRGRPAGVGDVVP
jgi:hypothetical protein